MRKFLGCAIILCLTCRAAFAIAITIFVNTDLFVKRSSDIIIADCVSIPTNKPVLVNGQWDVETMRDGLYKVEVNVIRTLKGDKQLGKQIIATIYPMTPGKKYLLSSLGGGGIGETGGIAATDFMAVPQLSVVEIPSNFDLKTLDGKELKEQMQSIFSRHLYEVEGELAPLIREKELLDKAVADRQSEWFDSGEPVKIGPIIETNTISIENWGVWLNLEDQKLQWSESTPGKNGFFYFEKFGVTGKSYWEFSTCDATNIESLVGKRLKTKFSGLFSPGTGGQSIQVSVGQVLFARTVDEPNKIYIVQIVGQDQNQERMSARYAIIQR
jgi:hypothetical protein